MSTTKTMRAGAPGRRSTPSRTAAKAGATRKGVVSVRRAAKPTTAYELLERVCDHILEEPRRYAQAIWGFERDMIAAIKAPPPCGTVCCRAGWVVALHDGPSALLTIGSVAGRSNEILGLDYGDTNAIYYDSSVDAHKQGTAAYATAGVRGLRAFMEQHKAHLQARRLKGV